MQSIDAFKVLEECLLQVGLVEDARWLNEVRTCCYTTSSEMLGEVGAMIRRIHRSIPEEAVHTLSKKFADCEAAVQSAWPSYTLDKR